MKVLVIGGAKSGKSMYSQNLSKKLENSHGRLIYLATMKPYDGEDVKRIEKHISDREGYNFKTVEKEKNIGELEKNLNNNDTVLLDCITSLLTNEMFCNGNFNLGVSKKIVSDIEKILKIVENIVIVSDNTSSDGIHYDEYTEGFKKELGLINRRLAEKCDVVIECSYGLINIIKGEEEWVHILGDF